MFGGNRRNSSLTWIFSALLAMVVIGGLAYTFYDHFGGKAGSAKRFLMDDRNPKIAAAEAEARRTWPEFMAMYRNRQPGQQFFVKSKFADGFSSEMLWVLVESITGDQIRGTVDVDPQLISNLQRNSVVTLNAPDISDWLVQSDLASHGGFTIKALNEIEAEQKAATQPTTRPR